MSLPSLRRLVIRPRQEWCSRKAGFHGGPEPRIVPAAPQELGRRAAERLFGRVAGEAREGGVHVDEPEARGLGDLHRIVDLLDRGRHQAEPLIGFSPGSDVAGRHGWAGLIDPGETGHHRRCRRCRPTKRRLHLPSWRRPSASTPKWQVAALLAEDRAWATLQGCPVVWAGPILMEEAMAVARVTEISVDLDAGLRGCRASGAEQGHPDAS